MVLISHPLTHIMLLVEWHWSQLRYKHGNRVALPYSLAMIVIQFLNRQENPIRTRETTAQGQSWPVSWYLNTDAACQTVFQSARISGSPDVNFWYYKYSSSKQYPFWYRISPISASWSMMPSFQCKHGVFSHPQIWFWGLTA